MLLRLSVKDLVFKGLFSKILIFSLVVFVFTSIFFPPFFIYEEVSNYNYYKIVSFKGELSTRDLARVSRVDGVNIVVGFGYSLYPSNSSNFFVVWVSGPASAFLNRYLLSGSVPSSYNGVLVTRDFKVNVGDDLFFNGTSFVVSGIVYSRLFNDIFSYQFTVPFIVIFNPIDSFKVLLVWTDIFTEKSYLEKEITNVLGDDVFVVNINKMPSMDRLSVLVFTMGSIAASFMITYMFINGFREEFAVLFGVGWKTRHIIKLAFARYVVVYLIGLVLSLLMLIIYVFFSQNMYFLVSPYFLFPTLIFIMNLVFIWLLISSLSRTFVEVLNG